MNILRSNDVKRINKIVIRKALLALRSATRKELMEATGISSSSIGSLIMEMVHEQDILEESIDSSTGGRCPMRYVLNYQAYRVLCMIVDREHADIHIMDSLYQEVHQEAIPIEDEEEFIHRIKLLADQYQVKSLNISTPGIINADIVVTDSKAGLTDTNVYKRIKEATQLPMHLDNDVKCMVQGYCAEHELEACNISYLYLSKEGGLGCASMAEGMILRGSDHLAGEIGLLEYNGRSMNNLLREHPQREETTAILARLISVLVCCINPSLIVLSGIDKAYEEELKKHVERIVSNRFSIQFAFDEENDYHILKALWTHALEQLMHKEDENL